MEHNHDTSKPKQNEGLSLTAYKCTEGFLTIGYGTRLPIHQVGIKSVEDAFGVTIATNPNKITKPMAELLFNARYDAVYTRLRVVKPIIAEIGKAREQILTEMAYQLGLTGLLAFKKMWAAIEAGRFERASDEILFKDGATKQTPSDLFKQTPNRCQYYAETMLTGEVA